MNKTKRLLILPLIVTFGLLYASSLTTDGSAPDRMVNLINSSIDVNTEGRGDISFTLTDYSERESSLFEGMILGTFTLSYNGKDVIVNFVGKDSKELESSLESELRDLLFYDESLMAERPRLDYIYGSSYSSVSDITYRKGTRLRAIDGEGKVRGLFEVSDVIGRAMELAPVYLNSPLPGIAIRKTGSWVVDGKIASSISSENYAAIASVSLGKTDLIYPVVPSLIALAEYDGSGFGFYGGLGISAYLDFNSIFPSVGFTLIQEGRIGATLSVVAGGSIDYGFKWGVNYEIFYEHQACSSFSWKIGYGYYLGHNMIMLGGSGTF